MHHPTDRIAFVTPVVDYWLEQNIAQWVHHEGSHPTTHRTMRRSILLGVKYILVQNVWDNCNAKNFNVRFEPTVPTHMATESTTNCTTGTSTKFIETRLKKNNI